MQSLEEMELSFKRDIKRRKRELEQSLILQTKDQEARAFRLKGLNTSESHVLIGDGPLLTPERQTCESGAAIEDIAWEPANVDEAEPGADDEVPDVADRGAKRPPPVNSDYLPLPWGGRLGYVSC